MDIERVDRGFAAHLKREVEFLSDWALRKMPDSDILSGCGNTPSVTSAIDRILVSASELTMAERQTQAFRDANAEYVSIREAFRGYWWMDKYPRTL